MGTLSIIAAVGKNLEIGKNNDLLWNIPEDMERFKKMTKGHTVVMGRRTFDSLWIKPLPGRKNIVMTSQDDIGFPTVHLAHTVQEILDAIRDDGEVFVIGGAKIYQLLLPHCTIMYLTFVHGSFDADTFFPEFDRSEWKETFRKDVAGNKEGGLSYSFVNFTRI